MDRIESVRNSVSSRRAMRAARPGVSIAVLLLLLPAGMALSGCATKQAADRAADDSASTGHGSMRMHAASGDADFAAMMVAHHQSAIDMAGAEVERGSREQVRALARRIVSDQTEEIAMLKVMGKAEGGRAAELDPAMSKRDADNLRMLREASGGDVDTMFLTHMIEHHRMGVEMARAAMPNLHRADVRALAERIISDQMRQIEQMQGMLG